MLRSVTAMADVRSSGCDGSNSDEWLDFRLGLFVNRTSMTTPLIARRRTPRPNSRTAL